MTRRSFLAFAFSLIPLAGKAYSLPVNTPHPNLSDEDMLRGLLYALIPSDDTPGAKEACLYEKLTRLISKDMRKRKRYEEGLSAMRNEIRTSQFKRVDWDGQWEKLSSATPFLRELRVDALRLFYSDPTGWKVVGYQGPPLSGYGDYYKCSSEVSFLQKSWEGHDERNL